MIGNDELYTCGYIVINDLFLYVYVLKVGLEHCEQQSEKITHLFIKCNAKRARLGIRS